MISLSNVEIETKESGYTGYGLRSCGHVCTYEQDYPDWERDLGPWTDTGTCRDYEVRYTVISGDWKLQSDNTDVEWFDEWLQMEPESFLRVYTYVGEESGQQVRVEVRDYLTKEILGSAVITAVNNI